MIYSDYYISSIPAPENKAVLSYRYGTTKDIISEVIDCYKESKDLTRNVALQLIGTDLYETCFNDWLFVKRNIGYIEDPEGMQFVKTPAVTWYDKFSDCKSYSILLGSLLYNQGISFKFRFVSYEKDKIPTHVYVIVPAADGEIILDDVQNEFDVEDSYTYKKDVSMSTTAIMRLSGRKERSAHVGDLWGWLSNTLDNVGDIVDTGANIYSTVNQAVHPGQYVPGQNVLPGGLGQPQDTYDPSRDKPATNNMPLILVGGAAILFLLLKK